jgi:predicted cupin superfamily sugar epimerase
MTTPSQVITLLGLSPHPEGGWFRETWRDGGGGARGSGTAIYYLLGTGERSHWHRIDATEVWHFYAGDPLDLALSPDGTEVHRTRLGPMVEDGQRPQLVVPPGTWQSATTSGAWSLVGCTVSPAFDFAGFELAPPGWAPGT